MAYWTIALLTKVREGNLYVTRSMYDQCLIPASASRRPARGSALVRRLRATCIPGEDTPLIEAVYRGALCKVGTYYTI